MKHLPDMPTAYQRRVAIIKAIERGWSYANCADLGEIVLCNIATCQNRDEAYLLGYWGAMLCAKYKISNNFDQA